MNKLLPFLTFSIILVSLGTFQNAEAQFPPSVIWTTPGDITVNEDPPGSGGANVVYNMVTVVNANTGDELVPDCSPFSLTGGFFPVGTTTVTCTVPDPNGRGSHTTTFDVTVTGNGSPPPPGPCPEDEGLPVGRFILSLFVPEMFRAYGGLGEETEAPPCSDLSITKSDNIDPVEIGTNLSYTLTVTNNGPYDATDVEINDDLPSGVTFVSASPDCTPSGSNVICDVGDLAVGQSKAFTIVVSVGFLVNNPLDNYASVYSNTIGFEDPDGGNDSATELTTPCIGDTPIVNDEEFIGGNFILSLLVPEQFRAFGGDDSPPLLPCTSPTSPDDGGLPYPRPHLGDARYGGGHDNGFCMNQNCINVVNNYFNHFPETTINQGTTQTFTLLVNCQRGAETCIHASIGGALPDSTFYDTRWDASLDKDIMTGEWSLTLKNDHEEIGTVIGNVQKVGDTFIQVTFNIQFLIPGSVGTHDGIGDPHENNRHLHVTVYDNQRGMSNYIFNEGMYVDDIYAYPQVEKSFDPVLEYEQLCINEDSRKRYTCAFEKLRQWTVENAEKALLENQGSLIKNNNIRESKSHDYDFSKRINDIELQNKLAYELEKAKDLFSSRYVITDADQDRKYWENYKQFLEKNS